MELNVLHMAASTTTMTVRNYFWSSVCNLTDKNIGFFSMTCCHLKNLFKTGVINPLFGSGHKHQAIFWKFFWHCQETTITDLKYLLFFVLLFWLFSYSVILWLAQKQENVYRLANGVKALPSVSLAPAVLPLTLTTLSPMKATSCLGTPPITIARMDTLPATILRWFVMLKACGHPLMAWRPLAASQASAFVHLTSPMQF